MQFVFQALTWGFLAALLPLLIHLINLVRTRRVKWAAMEFLLASYKKHQRWVWLKQFLLLLARTIAVALIVMMCAQWITADQWLNLFGGKATHHVVILDDSFSMSRRGGGASAFDQALKTITSLIAEAHDQETEHRFTLIRASRAIGYGAAESEASVHDAIDFHAATIDTEFKAKWESFRDSIDAGTLAVDLQESLAAASRLVDPAANEHRIVYVLSDFATKDWNAPAEKRAALQELRQAKCDLHFVDCVPKVDTNLAVTELIPDVDLKAAGVPLFVNVQVRNYGAQTARKVQVKVRSWFYPPAPPGETSSPRVEDLPSIVIDEIAPGETVSRRAQLFFPQAGRHAAEAILPDDAIAADNRRWCAIDCPEGERVLVIDGSDEQYHSYYLTAAFRPLERSNTGIRAEIKPASFLQEVTLETLRAYSVIYLLDVPRLERRAIENAEAFVRQGGGLAIFLGDRVQAAHYNEMWFREGQGLLPLALGTRLELARGEGGDEEPDFRASEHPVFSAFQGERNSFLSGVTIKNYFAPRGDWKSADHPDAKTFASLRSGEPLFMEKQLGDGVAVTVLTTAAPLWNDWAKNPSFVVLALKLQSYLSGSQRKEDRRFVGDPLLTSLESTKYLSDVIFRAPGADERETIETKRTAKARPNDPAQLIALLGRNDAGLRTGLTDRPGLYEMQAVSLQGNAETRRYALNVEAAEGDLAVIDRASLTEALSPLPFTMHSAEQIGGLVGRQAGYNRSMLIMGLLLLLLIGEQLLAYSAGYHAALGGVK